MYFKFSFKVDLAWIENSIKIICSKNLGWNICEFIIIRVLFFEQLQIVSVWKLVRQHSNNTPYILIMDWLLVWLLIVQ